MRTKKFCFLLLTIVLLFSSTTEAQKITYNRSAPDYEFSGLAKWKDKILLIPQHRNLKDTYNIIAIDTAEIHRYLKNLKKVNYPIRTDEQLYLSKEFTDSLQSIINNDLAGNTVLYGGFEAAVVNQDMIFFTVETDSPFCYIIKGNITKDSINFLNKLKLPKPDKCFKNAGFESILYLKDEKKLLALYEKNRDTANPSAFLIDDSLLYPPIPVKFKKPLLFRVTDVASIGGGNMIAVNHHYNDCEKDTCGEFNYYIGRSNRKKATKEMGGADPKKNSFTRLVKMRLNGNVIDWSQSGVISIDKNDWGNNWEGIISFKRGVLMMVDGRPPAKGNLPSKFKYFKIRN